jgi:hypothetical protein
MLSGCLSERETVVELPWAVDSCSCAAAAANRVTSMVNRRLTLCPPPPLFQHFASSGMTEERVSAYAVSLSPRLPLSALPPSAPACLAWALLLGARAPRELSALPPRPVPPAAPPKRHPVSS